jgi:hypothetical protein
MLFKNQGYDFFSKHGKLYKLDIYYGNKILLLGKQIIPFEEAALLQ